MGGIGMLSAGLIGGPGLGYSKDRFSSQTLNNSNPAVYEQVKAETPSKFLFLEPVNAIDGKKLAEAKAVAKEARSPEQEAIVMADQTGDRKTLTADSFIPLSMAVIYLLMLLYFKSIGGYKAVHIDEEK